MTNSPRVMYIDDEAALVHLFTRMLEHLGDVVEGYTRPERAIEAFRADPQRVNLVVTDFNMPGMSGLDVAGELLAIRPDLSIVLISGYVDVELVARSRALGIQHVVRKGNTVAELCDSIHRLLHGQQASPGVS